MSTEKADTDSNGCESICQEAGATLSTITFSASLLCRMTVVYGENIPTLDRNIFRDALISVS